MSQSDQLFCVLHVRLHYVLCLETHLDVPTHLMTSLLRTCMCVCCTDGDSDFTITFVHCHFHSVGFLQWHVTVTCYARFVIRH